MLKIMAECHPHGRTSILFYGREVIVVVAEITAKLAAESVGHNGTAVCCGHRSSAVQDIWRGKLPWNGTN